MTATVLKFGGTSVANAGRMGRVVEIVAGRVRSARPGPFVVVVSALAGVTDRLDAMTRDAAAGRHYGCDLVGLAAAHRTVLYDLGGGGCAEVEHSAVHVLDELESTLRGVGLVGESTERTRDAILSAGERLSALLLAHALRRKGVPARPVDARRLIVTDDRHGMGAVDVGVSERRIREELGHGTGVCVVPGFIAATAAGRTTTLGRGGGDHTAALVGAALGADTVEIWTDVDGVLTADPSSVAAARPLAEMAYDELVALSTFGAKVVYAPTADLARARGVSLLVRNTLNPGFPGTRVTERGTKAPGARSVATVSPVSLFRLGSCGAGSRERLQRALDDVGVDPLVAMSGAGGMSVVLAVRGSEAAPVEGAIRRALPAPRASGCIAVNHDVSCLTVVGRGVGRDPGLAAVALGALNQVGVEVHLASLGICDLTASVLISRHQEAPGLAAVHEALFAPAAARADSADVEGRRLNGLAQERFLRGTTPVRNSPS